MNDIIQNLQANCFNGEEYFCLMSENKLNALKELSKREEQENQQLKANLEMYENGVYFSSENDKLQEENQQLKEEINKYKRLGFKHLQDKNNKLEDNWNKLKEHFEFIKINSIGGDREFMEDIISLMQELERSDMKEKKSI